MELIDEQIFQNLKEIAGRYIALKKKVASINELSLSELNVLCVTSTCEPVMQTRLGEICGIDKPATSRLINKMFKSELIVKFNKDDNKKSSFIKLSEKGKVLVEKIQNEIREEKGELFKMLSNKDKEIALKLMDKVLK